ncbi:MAG: FMN-binding protein [Actinobacteria bacterium]|nr:FMN-binding protein [Actinomycetota bacterium]
MRRAALVAIGTVAGLAGVLSYSDGSVPVPIGLAASLPSTEPSDPTSVTAAPSSTPSIASRPSTASPSPTRSPLRRSSSSASPSSVPTAAPEPSTKPARTQRPSASATARPAPSPSPTRTRTPKPTPTPTPSTSSPQPGGDGEYRGTAVAHRYGTVQVAIAVQNGTIVSAWAVVYPTGSSTPYSQLAIPKLSAETVGATSANVTRVSGATLTSNAWNTSLAAAMTKAGLLP